MFHISKLCQKFFLDLSVSAPVRFENFRISKFASEIWVFTSWSIFHIFLNLQKIPQATSFTFHLFKLKFSLVTSLVLLSKRKISNKLKKMQGFGSCCLEARSIYISSPPNRELPEHFIRSGHPCSHQVVIKASGIPLGSHLPLVSSVLVFVP